MSEDVTTIKKLSAKTGLTPDAMRRRLKRDLGATVGINDPLSEDLQRYLLAGSRKGKRNGSSKPTRQTTIKPQPAKPTQSGAKWAFWLSILPLPMLGLAASYGVFYFSAFFLPTPVAIAEAAAFELTYIGLTALRGLSEYQAKRAQVVAKAAVIVSVAYNSLAGVMHLQPGWFENLAPAWVWVLGIVHGAPLAILAYQVAILLLHQNQK